MAQQLEEFYKTGKGRTRKERSNLYAKVLAEAWREANEEKEKLAHAVEGTSMRHSMSGKCARQVHYYLSGEEVTNPFDLPAVWATGLGSRIHVWWQDALVLAFPNCKVEVDVHIPSADSSGHVDAVIDETSLELKSINGFGFKKMAEGGSGPRHSDMVQLCVNAYGLECTEAVLVYMSLEAVSRGRAKQKGLAEHERILKEFHFDEEHIQTVAKRELSRWNYIRESGIHTPRSIPSPEYPPSAVVIDPSNGLMGIDGRPTGGACWECNYCAYQLKCVEDINADR